MPSTSVQVIMNQQRMMNEEGASVYTGFNSKKEFRKSCPVPPTILPNGKIAWDVHDLDRWIDTLKNDQSDSIEQVIAGLE